MADELSMVSVEFARLPVACSYLNGIQTGILIGCAIVTSLEVQRLLGQRERFFVFRSIAAASSSLSATSCGRLARHVLCKLQLYGVLWSRSSRWSEIYRLTTLGVKIACSLPWSSPCLTDKQEWHSSSWKNNHNYSRYGGLPLLGSPPQCHRYE